nr:hypothetical protein [Tanacetum cinerariifolium]
MIALGAFDAFNRKRISLHLRYLGWRLKMKMKMKMRYDACGRQQTDATFDLPKAYFSSKTLDDACKGIQNEITDTSEARAAIYGSAHVTNQGIQNKIADTLETRAAIYGQRTLLIKNKIADTLETRAAIYGQRTLLIK